MSPHHSDEWGGDNRLPPESIYGSHRHRMRRFNSVPDTLSRLAGDWLSLPKVRPTPLPAGRQVGDSAGRRQTTSIARSTDGGYEQIGGSPGPVATLLPGLPPVPVGPD